MIRNFILPEILLSFAIVVSLSSALPTAEAAGQTVNAYDIQAMRKLNPRQPAPIDIDQERVTAVGIQLLAGKHIRLYSDLRDPAKLKELVAIFDAAAPLWCKYFDVDYSKTKPWVMSGFAMVDRERFKRAGLLPPEIIKFQSGLHRGHEMWFDLQKDVYYTRHLMLHEGTHAFMQWILGGFGSPWYSEGMAEMLAVHRWENEKLELNYRLRDRSESVGWGRVKIIRDEYADKNAMKLDEVVAIDGALFGSENRCYAWSWAACKFFSEHTETKDAFRELASNVSNTDFSARFLAAINRQRKQIDRDWHAYLNEIDYGYLVASGIMREAAGSNQNTFTIDSRYGWQDTGVAVQAGDRFLVTASGRFQVAKKVHDGKPKIWPCESHGITIDYYRGRPLGMLIAGVDTGNGTATGLVKPVSVGASKEITFKKSGTLCLRINESPAHLDDNRGSLEVMVEKK